MSGLKIERLDSPLARSSMPPDERRATIAAAASRVQTNATIDLEAERDEHRPARDRQAPPLAAPTRQLATRLPDELVADFDHLVNELRADAGARPGDLPAQDVLGALIWDAVAAGPGQVGERVAAYRAARHTATAAAMRRP